MTGQWVYDITYTASDENLIDGESGATDTTAAAFSQALINTSDRLQWIEYTFTPKIKDPKTGLNYCMNGQPYKVRIWLNPTPHLEAIAEDTIYCDSSTVRFDIRNINGNVYGDKVYEVVVDYTPGTVNSTFVPGDFTLENPVTIFDQLVNLTDSLQEIRYTFRPKIWNPGNSVGKHCDNGIDTTIVIYLNPTPRIVAVLNPDSVVCDTSVIDIQFSEGNPKIIGQRYYYLDSEFTGSVSGVTPDGLYPLDAIISDLLVNNTKNLQIVTYHIKPVFRNTNGHDPHCERGIDTTIKIYLNPTPIFDSVYVSDTVICNKSVISFRFYNSQMLLPTSSVVYGLTTGYSATDISGVTPDGAGYTDLLLGFADTLDNSSTVIQSIIYHFTPKIDDSVRGLMCSNGVTESRIIKVVPTLSDTADTPEFIGGHNIKCYSEANGSILLSPSGGYYPRPYHYEWYSEGAPAGGNSPTINNLKSGWYSFNITDAIGCSYMDSVQLTQPDTILTTHTTRNVKCDGSNYYDGALYVTVTGGVPGFDFTWRGPEGFISHQQDSISNLRSGGYFLTLIDTNACRYDTFYYIDNPPEVTITPETSHFGDFNVSCTGFADGWIHSNVFGTGEPIYYHYIWRDGAGNIVDSTENLANIPADNYRLSVTDSIGCYSTLVIPLKEPDSLQITRTGTAHAAGFDISCFGLSDGIINLDISGSHSYRQGKSYSWTKAGDASFAETTKDISGLDTGTYFVVVTDTFNCAAQAAYSLLSPPEIQLAVEDSSNYNGYNVSCKSLNNGSYNLSISGGYGGFSYNWTTMDGHIDVPSDLDQSALTAGTYQLIATDNISCFKDWTFVLREPDTLAVNPVVSDYHSFNIACFNGNDGTITLNPSGGVGPYLFNWTGSGQGIIAGDQDQTEITAGNYSVQITDNNNCLFAHDFLLNQPEAVETSISPATIHCFGLNTGSADLSVTGGISPYSFLWNNGEISEDIDSLYVGRYYVMVTDQNNCKKSDSTDITEPPEIIVSLDAPQKFNGRMISCFGRSDADILTNVTGGVGAFRYSWFPGGITSHDLYNVPAGNYVLSVMDENDCLVYDSIEITQPQPVTTEIYSKDPSCYGFKDGEITLLPKGGTPDYSINWQETGKQGQTADSVGEGYYHVEIKDLNNCTLDTITKVDQPDSMFIMTDITEPDCPDKPNGGIRLNANGGTPPYSFVWSDDSRGSYLEDLGEGTYVVYVTDINQCIISDSLVLKSLNNSCLIIPTAFTPNGDGYNDTWEIRNIQLYPEVVIEIFSRWGEEIFHSDRGYDNPWDGTFRGRDLPIDSYFYIIDLGGGREPITGNVTIIK